MAQVIVYTANSCSYCVRARRLLDAKGVAYTEIYVDRDPKLRAEMMSKSQRRSVPQIFIGDYHAGGFDDLWQLDRDGRLDTLLQNSPDPS